MSSISTWSTTAASNNSASPDGFPENMAPSGVNDSAREVMAAMRTWYENAQWVDLGHVVTQTGATTFTVPTDLTSVYTVGRRLKLTDSSVLYGTVTAASYSAPDTTVTVALDSGSLSGSLSAASLSILDPSNHGLPDPLPAVDGSALTNLAATTYSYGIWEHQESVGVDGGTLTAGAWQVRTLNTEVADPDGIGSLSTNQLTLQAGTYRVIAWSISKMNEDHQTRLYDATNATTLITGFSNFNNNGAGTTELGVLSGRFTLAGAAALELQHRTYATNTKGMGDSCGWTTEVYAQIMVIKEP